MNLQELNLEFEEIELGVSLSGHNILNLNTHRNLRVVTSGRHTNAYVHCKVKRVIFIRECYGAVVGRY